MKRREIPSGYVSSFASHTDPAIAPPPPPIRQQKQAQTLMGHCLKEFIKQRLYGNMINYTRNANPKTVKLSAIHSNIHDESINKHRSSTSMQAAQQRRLSQVRQNLEKRMEGRYDSIVRKNRSQLQQNRSNYRYSLGNIQASMIDSIRPKNRSPLTNKYSPQDSSQRSNEEIQRYNKCSSFISQIDEQEGRDSKMKKLQKRLIPLKKRSVVSQMSQNKEDMRKKQSQSPLSPSRLQKPKFNINPQFWQTVCKRLRKDNELDIGLSSMLAKDSSTTTLLENKSLGSAFLSNMLGVKSGSQFPTINPTDKSKYFLTKLTFSRQKFLDYLSNSKHVVKRLAQFLYYFFELSGKAYDELKSEDYKEMMESITTAGPRVWAVCAFRFWDTDQNGLICSSDLFKIFKDLDQLKTQLKQTFSDCQHLSSYKMVESLIKIIDKLRSLSLEERLNEGLKKIQNKVAKQAQFQIKYLQESVLKRKELKQSDLTLILGHNYKITSKQAKKSVIETTKQISTKMSSCYRFSFLATDHNEQTREDRQQIQNLKQSLRRQKMELVDLSYDQQLINKKIPGINYTTFLENRLFRPMKDLAYLIFGIQPV